MMKTRRRGLPDRPGKMSERLPASLPPQTIPQKIFPPFTSFILHCFLLPPFPSVPPPHSSHPFPTSRSFSPFLLPYSASLHSHLTLPSFLHPPFPQIPLTTSPLPNSFPPFHPSLSLLYFPLSSLFPLRSPLVDLPLPSFALLYLPSPQHA